MAHQSVVVRQVGGSIPDAVAIHIFAGSQVWAARLILAAPAWTYGHLEERFDFGMSVPIAGVSQGASYPRSLFFV